MKLTVEAAAGKFSVSAEWTNPLRYSKVETPKASEYQLPLFEVELGENGIIPQPKGSNRFLESLKKPFNNIFGRRKETSQAKEEILDSSLAREFNLTNQRADSWVTFGLVTFSGISALAVWSYNQIKPPEVKISPPPNLPEAPKPTVLPHTPFDFAGILNQIDQVQQNLHPEEMAQAPKIEIPSAQIEPEEPEILPDEEILTDQKLSDEQIIAKVVTGHGQFAQILSLLKENSEEHPSSERMISLFRLNFMKKVEDFKASANGIINNPYEYPDSNMQRKAREQLAAIDYLLNAYEEGREMAFEIELEYNRKAQNYSAPPPEILVYALAA